MPNIWHPVNHVPDVQRRVLRLVGGLVDLTVQLSAGRDYYLDDRVERLDRQWRDISDLLLEGPHELSTASVVPTRNRREGVT